jgi:hypothetical protein
MKIPAQTLKKMEAGAGTPPTGRHSRRWQFSILAILAWTAISSLAMVALKAYWPALEEALTRKAPGTPVTVQVGDAKEPEILVPLMFQPDDPYVVEPLIIDFPEQTDGCGGCGLG